MQRSDNPRQRENLSKYGEMNAPAPGQKKHRLSRFLGSNKDQQPETRPHVHSQPDSAYASDNTGNDIVQVENDGSIPNTKRDQHLALDRGTGEVFDEDTGEVVTVVTTTTTTTTTTTSRPGGQQRQDVQKDVQTTQHQQPHGAGTTTTTGSMAPHSHEPYRDSGYGSGLPTEGRIASGVPEHADPYKGGSYGAGSQHHSSTAPHIPARSPRRSGEYGRTSDYDSTSHPSGSYNPTSPSRHNFSYPSRAAPGAQGAYPTETGYPPEQEVRAKKTGRFADLKAAAIGLHGVGETLRGTLNSTIDDRLPRQNAEKAAAARAKNEAVLSRGRSEMSTISHRDSRGTLNQGYSAAPVSSNVTGYTNEPSYGHQTTTTGVPGTGHHEPSYSHQTSATGIPGTSRHEPSYSHHTPATGVHGTSNEHRGHLPPDPNSNLRGNAHDGSHSAAFGLTPDGHRNTDTTAPTPMQTSQANLGTNDLSSVSGMGSSSSNTTVNTPGEKHHIPPRGTAVRGSSDYAPETISGNVEHVPTTQQSGHTDTSNTSHLNQSNTGHLGQSNTSHIDHPNTGHTDTYNTSHLNQPTSGHLNQSNTGFTGTSNTGLNNQGNTGYTGTSNTGLTNQGNTGYTGTSDTGPINQGNNNYTGTSNTSHLNQPNTGYSGTSNTGLSSQGNTGYTGTSNQSNTGYTGTSNTSHLNQANTGNTGVSNTSHLNNPNTGYTGTPDTGLSNQGNTGHLGQSNTGYTGTSNTGNMDQSNESVSPVTRDDYASPNSAAEENNLKKTGTLGKLFKRKPVGSNTAQDTTTSGTSGTAKKYF